MSVKHWVVNKRTKTYVETEVELDEDWKDAFPHVKDEPWVNVVAYRVWEHDQTDNGIYFDYDLVYDGGLFLLLVDTTRHSSDQIEAAKKQLRNDRDVVSLRVLRLIPAKTEKD